MPALTYLVATSLDGFIADSDGGFSSFSVEGDHIAHLIAAYPETLPAHARAALGIDEPGLHFDTVVMGWNTFAVGLAEGLTSPYPHLRQLVFSRRDRSAEVGEGVEVIAGNPRDVIDELRAGPGQRDIWLCGGGQLAGQLVESIDRLVLKVNPVVIGAGIPLFGTSGISPAAFELAGPPRPFESGVVFLEYRRA
ncbi:hypothetical protein ENSA5_40370 [Enhygromyxa salina]|uniref:Bacterial bifunctional deaminase-reductase C-terminal domain-containing protein n=1 Tax=Enhygromyxa salina TaxID=215803 RepID=A0A2S9XQ95_9BACT|nr:dihydrofolate reductase family protein [Enhygromyxa salina]PRP95039.1 hypothetical protein ENSA5_40370 [Enhygromyxa salina]